MVTRAEIVTTLAAIARRLDARVEIWHVIIDANDQPTGRRIYFGSFTAPADYVPPTLEQLMIAAKGRA